MNKYELLDLLYNNPSDFLSGEMLGEKFKISRTTIWNTVNELKADGYAIESVSKSGYKLMLPNDILSKYELDRRLKSQCNIEFFESLPSTNSYAASLAENGAENFTLVVTNSQSGGKAKEHGCFFSPPNTGIYMSLILRPENLSLNSLPAFKQALTEKILAYIKEAAKTDVSLSDNSKLIASGKQLGGILTQASVEVESKLVEYLVLGIGIYVNESRFPKELKPTHTSLKILTKEVHNRADIIEKLLQSTITP